MKTRMVSLFLSLIVMAMAQAASAAEKVFSVKSPGGRIELQVMAGAALTYTVSFDGQPLLLSSRLGLEFDGVAPFTRDFEVTRSTTSQIDATWENPLGKCRRVRDRAAELTLDLRQVDEFSGRLGLVFRVYDDAVAFRYTIPRQPLLHGFVLTRDASEFAFAGDPTVWAAHYKAFKSPQESEFEKTPLSALDKKMPVGVPLLVKVSPKAWVAITEAGLTDWAGMWVGPADKTGVLTAQLAPRLDQKGLVVSSAPRTSPWRVVLIGDRPGAPIESNTILNLNPPCKLADASWVKPGMMAWDRWWTGGIPVTMESDKEFIRFAAEMGWPYQLIDGGWYVRPTRQTGDVTQTIPEMNIPKLVAYARQRGVRLWVWNYWSALDPMMDKAFAQYEKWGLAGVKIDFMDRDDQEMVRWYEKTVRKAAAHHLMIDFHGAFKPTGMNRTWPNQITREGIMGNEYNKWSRRVNPTHTVTLPFTRLVAGPADFTPGGFLNCTSETFSTGIPAKVLGTRGHQLAMFVIYDSPVCCVCDHPKYYKDQPGLEFLKHVPTVWDETRVLEGEPGEFIVEARRKGGEWYLGAMTNESARTVRVPLSFLGAGRYQAAIWADTPASAKDAQKLSEMKKEVQAGDVLEFKMAPGGGGVARLVKVE